MDIGYDAELRVIDKIDRALVDLLTSWGGRRTSSKDLGRKHKIGIKR